MNYEITLHENDTAAMNDINSIEDFRMKVEDVENPKGAIEEWAERIGCSSCDSCDEMGSERAWIATFRDGSAARITDVA